MKSTKKVLGVLLALAMMLNIFAVVSFAQANDSSIDLSIECTKVETEETKGKVATFTVSVQMDSDATEGACMSGQFCFAYDSTKLTPYGGSSINAADHGIVCSYSEYDPSGTTVATSGDTDPIDEGYGWDTLIRINLIGDGATAYDFTTKKELFSFKMIVNDELSDGTYKDVIGFNGGAYDSMNGYMDGGAMGMQCMYIAEYSATNLFNFGRCDLVLGEATKPIVFDKTQAQWADGTNKVQDTWKLGIVGKFKTSDIDIAFNDAGTSTNVTAVGVDVTAGDFTKTETTRFVYDNGDGTYSYRAVITNIPADVSAEDEITVTFFAMVGGEKVEGETVTINLADALAAAQANGMAK